jgi:hypothetical protein
MLMDIVHAKRLGWNEGATGNVTRVDILDPYDYDDDDLEGVHTQVEVANDRIGPYTQHIVDGQLADPDSIAPITVVRPVGDPSPPHLPDGTTQVTPGYMTADDWNPASVLRTPGDPPHEPVIVVSDGPAA